MRAFQGHLPCFGTSVVGNEGRKDFRSEKYEFHLMKNCGTIGKKRTDAKLGEKNLDRPGIEHGMSAVQGDRVTATPLVAWNL